MFMSLDLNRVFGTIFHDTGMLEPTVNFIRYNYSYSNDYRYNWTDYFNPNYKPDPMWVPYNTRAYFPQIDYVSTTSMAAKIVTVKVAKNVILATKVIVKVAAAVAVVGVFSVVCWKAVSLPK